MPVENEKLVPCPSKRSFTKDDFEFEKPLGVGQFGKVWLAREKKSNGYVAIKVINAATRNKENDLKLFFETIVQKRLRHPNVIRRLASFQHGRNLFFVLEYAANGSLHELLVHSGKFNDRLASKFVYKTTEALLACHGIGFLHGDVKPENILIDHHHNVKLADFGLTWPYFCGRRRGYWGTTDYLAPEVLREGEDYNKSIDFWSVGVLIFELLCGYNPFRVKSLRDTRKNIEDCNYIIPKGIREDAKDLIRKLIVVNPEKRLPLQEVIAHPWIKNNFVSPSDHEEEC